MKLTRAIDGSALSNKIRNIKLKSFISLVLLLVALSLTIVGLINSQSRLNVRATGVPDKIEVVYVIKNKPLANNQAYWAHKSFNFTPGASNNSGRLAGFDEDGKIINDGNFLAGWKPYFKYNPSDKIFYKWDHWNTEENNGGTSFAGGYRMTKSDIAATGKFNTSTNTLTLYAQYSEHDIVKVSYHANPDDLSEKKSKELYVGVDYIQEYKHNNVVRSDGRISGPNDQGVIVHGDAYSPVAGKKFIAWSTEPNAAGKWYSGGRFFKDIDDGDLKSQVNATDSTLNLYAVYESQITLSAINSDSRSPKIEGTIDNPKNPRLKIKVKINNAEYDAKNNGDGTWALPAGTISELANGDYPVEVISTDPLNNELKVNGSLKVNVAPIATIITTDSDQKSPEITGTVDNPNATIKVKINNAEYDATNNGDGTWTLPAGTVQPELTNGNHAFEVTVTDPEGNEIKVNGSLRVNAAPIITITTTDSDQKSPEIAGTVDNPSAIIKVKIDGTEYNAINNGDGTWILPEGTIQPELHNGDYPIEVTVTDPEGNVTKKGGIVKIADSTTAPLTTEVDQVAHTPTEPQLLSTGQNTTDAIILSASVLLVSLIGAGSFTALKKQ